MKKFLVPFLFVLAAGALSFYAGRRCAETGPLETIAGRVDTLVIRDTIRVQAPKETAIPTGTYGVAMNVTSPKYAAVAWYWRFCRGKMPRILAVPGFEGILIHPGGSNGPLDTRGCILVGRNTKVGKLTESKATFQELYRKMKAAYDRERKSQSKSYSYEIQ